MPFHRVHQHPLDSSDLHHPSRRPRSIFNLFSFRRRANPTASVVPSSVPTSSPRHHRSHQRPLHEHQNLKPIYIYPGLLRTAREKAIAIDNQCPAVLYKCRDCRREKGTSGECTHQRSCAICLDEFHGKDLVRKLPCNPNHIYHSKCILDWFVSNQRCPLCNERITHTITAIHSTQQTESINSHRPHSQLRHHATARGSMSSRALPHVSDDVRRRHLSDSAASTLNRREPTVHEDASAHTTDSSANSTDASSQRNSEMSKRTSPRAGKKGRGPRTYSYIVHDNVRMELNPVIPA